MALWYPDHGSKHERQAKTCKFGNTHDSLMPGSCGDCYGRPDSERTLELCKEVAQGGADQKDWIMGSR